MDDCLKMAACKGNRSRVWGLFLSFFSVFLSFKTLFHLLFSSESSFIPLIPLRVKLARSTVKGKKAILLGEQVDEQYPHPALTY